MLVNNIISFSLAAIPFSTPVAPVAPHLKCQTQGCTNQKYLNPEGGYFDYCSKSCRDNAMLTSGIIVQLRLKA